jgi:hypothetical protein
MFLWSLHFTTKARLQFEADQSAKAETAAPPIAAVPDEGGPSARPAAA